MKSGLQKVVALSIATLAIQSTSAAEIPVSTNSTQNLSYSIGVSIGNSIKRGGFEVDPKVVGEAIQDVLSGATVKVTEQQAQETIRAYQQETMAKREQERLRLAEKNRAEAEKFLAMNKQKEGVKVHSVKQGEGAVELQYKVITEGSGASPRLDDSVTFNYAATTSDGKEIDSTAKRGQPVKTVLAQFPIVGVKEALQLMKPGAKWQLFIPPVLAFGDRSPAPNVEPGSAIVFDVELVSAEPREPLTSDIIKVPSKEELDKGAKIETLTPADVKRLMESNSAAEKK
jgi:FKBP-type peptidyl-prolyl cis-trans isomerase FklB